MSEKTLLVELEKDKAKIVEKKLAHIAAETEKRKEEKKEKKENKPFKNVFSSKSFKGNDKGTEILKKSKETQTQIATQNQDVQPSEEQEIAKLESKVSSVIEKPNYDYIETLTEVEREKVFKVEKKQEAKAKPKPSKLKLIVISILFAIFGVWGVVNIAQIDNLGNRIAEVAYDYYEFNLPKYLKNLGSLDATNSSNMENLFETIPDEDKSPSEIIEKSNWFDRFCNFIAGLFGG